MKKQVVREDCSTWLCRGGNKKYFGKERKGEEAEKTVLTKEPIEKEVAHARLTSRNSSEADIAKNRSWYGERASFS